MLYGENEGATGYLVGEEHKGLAAHVHHDERRAPAVGVQGVAIAERATQQALAFAQERRQGRRSGRQGRTGGDLRPPGRASVCC